MSDKMTKKAQKEKEFPTSMRFPESTIHKANALVARCNSAVENGTLKLGSATYTVPPAGVNRSWLLRLAAGKGLEVLDKEIPKAPVYTPAAALE